MNRMPKIYEQVTQKHSKFLRASRISLEAANKFMSENPYFSVPLRSGHRKNVVWSFTIVPHLPQVLVLNLSPIYFITLHLFFMQNVQASFFKSFFNRKKQTVKLQVEDRSWPVNLVPNGNFAGRLSGGWARFAKEHCLKEGDVCIFELTEMNGSALKVHVFRCWICNIFEIL